MPQERQKPIHPFVQGIWDEHSIGGVLEAAAKSQADPDAIRHAIDIHRVDAFLRKLEQWARLTGVQVVPFLEYALRYFKEQEKATKKAS